MNEFEVVIPTLGKPHAAICREFVESHIGPGCQAIHWVSEGKSWPEAVNIGLSRVWDGRDVLLMDDDIFIMPNTLNGLSNYYQHADMFGFKLLYADGRIQHGGGWFTKDNLGHRGHGEVDAGQCDHPMYVAHLTTSCIYIKAHVLEKLGGMATDYPGMQFEDVDFSIRAIKAGFKLLYLPNRAIHLESQSKKNLEQFRIRMKVNERELRRRHLQDPSTIELLTSYPRPFELVAVAS